MNPFSGQLKNISPLLDDIGRNLTLEKLIGMSQSKSRFHHEPQIIWLMQGINYFLILVIRPNITPLYCYKLGKHFCVLCQLLQ